MPIYEYVCVQCGNRFEAFQKVNDSPLRKCRTCGGALKKVISSPAIQFKGNGWYITDYARKASPEKEEKAQPPATSAGSSSDKGPTATDKASLTKD